jgi:hypothetical protein
MYTFLYADSDSQKIFEKNLTSVHLSIITDWKYLLTKPLQSQLTKEHFNVYNRSDYAGGHRAVILPP